MDLPALISELHLRGFDQEKVDSSLRLLVHVYAVQGYSPPDIGGILVEDLIETYDIDVIQAATQLYLDKAKVEGREIFRVKWGCTDAARTMEEELWEHAFSRWGEYVAQADGKYLGFLMPLTDDGARVLSNWKLSKELKWFSIEIPRQGWKLLSMMNDITEVAWKLDLAFGFRPFSSEGVQGPRVLLHAKAYELLKEKKTPPPGDLINSIRMWKFFAEYDVKSTDIVPLMKECGLSVEDISQQIGRFFEMNLTSQFRDGQYPPFFINDKKKKEFKVAVSELLKPMDVWLMQSAAEQLHSEGEVSAATIEAALENVSTVRERALAVAS